MTLAKKTFGEMFDFTRASPKWVFDASGTLVEVPIDTPAYDHDPVTGESLGVLIEESRTNQVAQSHNLTSWGSNRVTATPSSSSKSGLPTTVISADAGLAGGIFWVRAANAFSSNSATGRVVQFVLRFVDGTSDPIEMGGPVDGDYSLRWWASVDPTTGDVVSTSDISMSDVSSRPIGEGFYEYTCVLPDGINFSRDVSIRAEVDTSIATEPTPLFEVMHVSAEEGVTTASASYIPTAGAAVTRAADNMYRTLGDEFNAGELSIYIEFYKLSGDATSRIFSVSDGTQSNRITGYSGDFTNLLVTVGGSNQCNIPANSSVLIGEKTKYAATISKDYFAASINGSPAAVDTTGDVPQGLTTLSLAINSSLNGNRMGGAYTMLKVFPYAMTAAELEALTTL